MRLVLSALLVGVVAVGLIAVGPLQVANPITPGVLTGVVVDDTGTAVAGATVDLRVGARVERTTVTDANGGFRFEKVVAGVYEIRAFMAGFQPVSMSVEVVKDRPTAAVRLALVRPARTEADRAQAKLAADKPEGALGGVLGSLTAAPLSSSEQVRVGGNLSTMARGQAAMAPSAIFNTEAYDKIDENRFHRVGDDPLSTFSIDVDTASYANVRRFLNDGTLPPADAVRVEELINYFRFDYKDSAEGAPFSVTTEVAACPWNPRHRLALIGLQARRMTAERTPPRNLVFLLDVSGSMDAPDKLPLVKTAMRMLADTLNPADRVAIVVYAGASGLVLPSTPGSRQGGDPEGDRRPAAGRIDQRRGRHPAGLRHRQPVVPQGRHQPRHPRDRR